MTTLNDTDAEFVIFAGRLADGTVGYANHNGDLVAPWGLTWDYRQVMATARNLALSMGRGVWVAPLLFSIPDVEGLAWIDPEAV